jgi:ankyrin repeat protein
MLNPSIIRRCARLLLPVLFIIMLISGKCRAQAMAAPDNLNREIFRVIRSGNAAQLDSLLQRGADANASGDGYSALMAAALNGNAAQMEMLINHGAVVNAVNADGFTALWFSIPDYEKVSLLLNHGADPGLRSKEGFTVLAKLANYPGTLKIFRLLMEHGADLLHSGPDNSLIYNAASSCDTALMSFLVGRGLSVNDTISVGDYPINSALNYRCFPMVKWLVDHGAKVNVAPMHLPLDLFNGITPLMFAGVSDDSLSFFYLLDHGADPNAKDKQGHTVLMFVQQAEHEEPEMTKTLLERGANPLEKARDETDALSIAVLKGNTGTVNLLKEYANH